MSPLGLFITNLGGMGGPLAMGDTGGSVVIADYMWQGASNGGTAGELTPLEAGTVSDFNDTWDLDGTDYMPHDITTQTDEGYWEGASIGPNGEILPLDV